MSVGDIPKLFSLAIETLAKVVAPLSTMDCHCSTPASRINRDTEFGGIYLYFDEQLHMVNDRITRYTYCSDYYIY